MAESKLLPATRTELETTMPNMEITAASLAPPPIFTIMFPEGVPTGMSAPSAAARGSGNRYAVRAPAWMAASRTARLSTLVTPTGTLIITSGRRSNRLHTLEIK